MGKLDEAKVLYRQALHIREACQGQEHPDCASSLNNMAALLHSDGELDEAEVLYRRALRILEGYFGHNDKVSILSSYASPLPPSTFVPLTTRSSFLLSL
jgi:tetratricopeptide (TPR) repeat protein